MTEKEKNDVLCYAIAGTGVFMILFSAAATGWSFLTWIFIITTISSGIYAFIRRPSVVFTAIKMIIALAIFAGILFSPMIYAVIKGI